LDKRAAYTHIQELGLTFEGRGLNFLLSMTRMALSDGPSDEKEPKVFRDRALDNVISILHYCDEQEQRLCLAVISSLLSASSIEFSPRKAVLEADYFSLLTNNQKLDVIMAELSGEDVAMFLRGNNTAAKFSGIIVDFCVHSCPQLLREMQNELRNFNRLLAKDLIEFKKRSPRECYSVESREEIRSRSVGAVQAVLEIIFNSQPNLPKLFHRFLWLANDILLNNFGVVNDNERFQIVGGFCLNRFWPKLLHVNCVNFVEPEFKEVARGRYRLSEFESDIVAVYNTLICNVVQKLTCTDARGQENNTKYSQAQLQVIWSASNRERLRGHVQCICKQKFSPEHTTAAVNLDNLMSSREVLEIEQAISLRLKLDDKPPPSPSSDSSVSPTSPFSQLMSPHSGDRRLSLHLKKRSSSEVTMGSTSAASSPRRITSPPGRGFSGFLSKRKPSEPNIRDGTTVLEPGKDDESGNTM